MDRCLWQPPQNISQLNQNCRESVDRNHPIEPRLTFDEMLALTRVKGERRQCIRRSSHLYGRSPSSPSGLFGFPRIRLGRSPAPFLLAFIDNSLFIDFAPFGSRAYKLLDGAFMIFVCPACGSKFECTPDKTCWCTALLTLPLSGGRCFCPECLKRKVDEPRELMPGQDAG